MIRKSLVAAVVVVAAAAFTAAGWAANTAPPGDPALLGLWKAQNSHSATELRGVFFADHNNGWVVGGEHFSDGGGLNGLTVVRHTTDGGNNWLEDTGAKNAETLAAGHELTRAFAVGSDVWIIGEMTDYQSGPSPCDMTTPANTPNDQSIVLHSGDGGLNWARLSTGTCEDPESMYMFDAQHGLIGFTCFSPACGSSPFYMQTSNGGQTWTPRTFAAAGAPSGCSENADSLSFPPSSKPFGQREGWLVDKCFLHTTDGGQTWAEQKVDGLSGSAGDFPENFEQVYGPDVNSLMAVGGSLTGDAPTLRRVANYNPAAGNWTSKIVTGNETAGQHLGVAFVDNRWYVLGESPCCDESMTMFVSSDYGTNWFELTPPGGSAQIYSGGVFTLDSRHAWAVGQAGTVIAYRNEPAPTASTDAPAAITQHAATLNGTVNPQGNPANYVFEYGPTTAYGRQTAPQSAGAGSAGQAVSAVLDDLRAGRAYHYRVVATGEFGTATGADQSFSTIGRITPAALTLKPLKRSKKRPATLSLSGTMSLPAGVQTADGCNGFVLLRVKLGKQTLSEARVPLTSTCTFAKTAKLKAKGMPKKGRLTISAEFLGNEALAGKAGAPASARFG
jgi:photosystem II stability/assembly factor-like uncharacterized protein